MRIQVSVWVIMLVTLAVATPVQAMEKSMTNKQAHARNFTIGPDDFLIDGKPMVIRCGEIHFARVPPEYWRHRLKTLKAMGLNTVCAYLFWNFHERECGQFTWTGEADAAAFCRIAQEEGLWVILRPGPYACAEWDGGGLPWWLLKNPHIRMRTSDPAFMEPATAWLKEVGRVLAPLQVTHGGPILMVQVENEYGSYGRDAAYMGQVRQAMVDAGFGVPLFACNPAGDLRHGFRDDLYPVVNFGRDAEDSFRRLRELLPHGPLMCGEFYPGWFDTWGSPHHLGNTPQYLADLNYMLEHRCSFSLYMAHGGTTFGLWAGADRPFKPDTSSYDYDAPVSEAGWIGGKYHKTRELLAKHLEPGEKLPDPPAPLPVMAIPAFTLTRTARLFDNLPPAIESAGLACMESFGQGQGCILYRAVIPAGPAAVLRVDPIGDFGWVFVDGQGIGIFDRRESRHELSVPPRSHPSRLDILVEAMGHVNFGQEIHDRKGLTGAVTIEKRPISSWQVYPLRLDATMLAGLKWQQEESRKSMKNQRTPGPAFSPTALLASVPAFWRGNFTVDQPADTFLDLRAWGKGVVWVNGHCLGRFWNIGPSQTAYLPGAWLKTGVNDIVILDLLGPSEPLVAGLTKPINDLLRPELDFANVRRQDTSFAMEHMKPVLSASFNPGAAVQEVRFAEPVAGRCFCLETLNAHDGKPFAAVAELDLMDKAGRSLPHTSWTIAFVDSEEKQGDDGSASNAIDGQVNSIWHTQWKNAQPGHPHRLIIDLGKVEQVGGFRYTPRMGHEVAGRIKDYRICIAP